MAGPLSTGDAEVITKALALKGSPHSATLTGALVLDLTYPNVLLLDPGGADRDVTLPAEDGNTASGLGITIRNTADADGEDLVVKNDAGTTIATLIRGDVGQFRNDGTSWKIEAHVPASAPNELRTGAKSQALSAGDLTLTAADKSVQVIVPSGASRSVTLPAAADAPGKVFQITNAAASDLAVSAVIPGIGTVALHRGRTLKVASDGTSWTGIGSSVLQTNSPIEATTLAGAHTLEVTDSTVQRLDPDGAHRDVNLPAVAVSKDVSFRIVNTAGGAENLVVKAAGVTIVTIGQNQAAWVRCSNSAWAYDCLDTITP
jgi:hypothetical protein